LPRRAPGRGLSAGEYDWLEERFRRYDDRLLAQQREIEDLARGLRETRRDVGPLLGKTAILILLLLAIVARLWDWGAK
jgi:hypothetical protein